MSLGIVNITDKNNKTLFKVFVDCNGHNINRFIDKIQKLEKYSKNELYKIAKATKFGSNECLVVLSSDRNYIGKRRLSEDSGYFTSLVVNNQHPNSNLSAVMYQNKIILSRPPFNTDVLLKRLRNTKFPNTEKIKKSELKKVANLCNITDEQIDKIKEIKVKKFGKGNPGIDLSNDKFLESIITSKTITFGDKPNRVLDDCLLDVYQIAPELFDIDSLKSYYRKIGVLIDDEVVHEVRLKKFNEARFAYVFLRNDRVVGSFDYDKTQNQISSICMNLKKYLADENIDCASLLEAFNTEKNEAKIA